MTTAKKSLLTKSFGLGVAGLLALSLAACSTDDGATTDTGSEPAVSNEQATEEIFETEDTWVKATQDEEDIDAMTSAFGHLTNNSDEDITITSVTSDLDGIVEMHEMYDDNGEMKMREIDGGFDVPAGETLILEPGGLHFMLMELTEVIKPGENITFTVETEDGRTQDIVFEAREFVGAHENYGDIDHDGHDHGDHDHDMHGDDEEDH